MPYQIFTDSSSDLSTKERRENNIEYFRMKINVSGNEMDADIDWELYSYEQLYAWVGDISNHCKTSLIGVKEFLDRMEPVLQEGKDIIYIACSSGLSGSWNVFNLAKRELEDKYPERKMIVVDSLRADMALGLMVLKAAKMQQKGATIEEVEQYILDRRQYFHQCGSCETLKYLKEAGRVSGAAAFFGNIIGLKPCIMFDVNGKNYAYAKKRGSKAAIEEVFDYVKRNVVEGVTDVIYVGHAIAKERQQYLKKRIEEELHIPVIESLVGPIVGLSVGPGMYGVWFEGSEVTADSNKK